MNEFDPLFDDIYAFCEAQDIEIDTLIHEDGPAQMEINLLHGDPLDLADQAFLFKRTAREAALRHKMYTTFMAKPHAKEPAAPCTSTRASWTGRTRQNIFSNADGTPSQLFFAHIAGAAEISACGHVAVRAEREFLSPHHPFGGWRRSMCSGAMTTAPAPARAGVQSGESSRREPRRRRGCEPLSCHCGIAGLRLPRHAGETEPHRTHQQQRTRSAVRAAALRSTGAVRRLGESEPLIKLLGELS